jgi:hypothetical protein
VKTLWICGLLSLISIVAYSQIAVALSGAAEPRFETKKSPSIAAPSPLPNKPIGAIARNASSGRPAPGATRTDTDLTENLSSYLFWHKTWNETVPAATTEKLGGCSE